MKSRFFYGLFAGFFLACLFFFGVSQVRAQALGEYQQRAYEQRSSDDSSSSAKAYETYDEVAYNDDNTASWKAYDDPSGSNLIAYAYQYADYAYQYSAYDYSGAEQYQADTYDTSASV